MILNAVLWGMTYLLGSVVSPHSQWTCTDIPCSNCGFSLQEFATSTPCSLDGKCRIHGLSVRECRKPILTNRRRRCPHCETDVPLLDKGCGGKHIVAHGFGCELVQQRGTD
ncbi:putative signal peptide protein [Puccinia sorghi]|uniref:Putative signal peptide protein n=1 Tax=Puccinia sorghi TaxID=27349 RepID=A0A0L6UNP8_9BASI|nr:putative signal peptide protein [Puccinia sorghi]